MGTSNPTRLATALLLFSMGVSACAPPADDPDALAAKEAQDGNTWLAAGIGLVAGMVIGGAIESHFANSSSGGGDSYSFSRYSSGYDGEGYDEVDSGPPQPQQINVPDNNTSMTKLRQAAANSLRQVAGTIISKQAGAYACDALCGGYWNGSTYHSLTYDDTYYGSALFFSEVMSYGSSAADAFANLKNACPAGSTVIDPASYSKAVAYTAKALRSGTAANVCIPTPSTGVSCSGTCAIKAKDGTSTSKDLTVKYGDALGGYLGLMYGPDCVGKVVFQTDHTWDVTGPKGAALWLKNACIADPSAAPPPAGAIPDAQRTADGRISAFGKSAEVSCSKALCDQIDSVSDTNNCQQAVRKDDGSMVLQFWESQCPQDDPTRLMPLEGMTMQLAMTDQPDPQWAMATDEDLKNWKFTKVPHSGNITFTPPDGAPIALGTWMEWPTQTDDFVQVTSLCTTKAALDFPSQGTSFPFKCPLDLTGGHFLQIGPVKSTTNPTYGQ
jgi:hypothetical protein